MRLDGGGFADPSDETDTTTGNTIQVGQDMHSTTYITIRKYKWVCHGDHPCETCQSFGGKVYTEDEWIMKGITPGWHKHCKCEFVEVDEKISADHDSRLYIMMHILEDNLPMDSIWDPEDGTWQQ
ncbi:MAG: hypothetical protein P4L50_15890 [Anaerolineaceae bacterium]|nr:hypothetical protein [Anaerolineaceae bacterium]